MNKNFIFHFKLWENFSTYSSKIEIYLSELVTTINQSKNNLLTTEMSLKQLNEVKKAQGRPKSLSLITSNGLKSLFGGGRKKSTIVQKEPEVEISGPV